MADPTPETAAAETAASEATADDPRAKLVGLGIDDDIAGKIIEDLGVQSVGDLAILTEGDLTTAGIKPIQARKLLAALAPVSTADATAELADGEEPSKDQVAGFASSLGIDPTMMLMFMSGAGDGEFDLSGMMAIDPIVNGYNAKRRDMFLMAMGQIERRLGVPIVVIDGNGAVNRPLTVEYIEGLEEGRDPAENNIYFGSDGAPHEVIRVGVDAQSIYDADPLDSSKALQRSGMGIGRVNWSGIPLEVRQVAYFAVNTTHEIDPANDAHQSWLRDHIKEGTNRLIFHGQAPRAITQYNEAARTGSLPTLRVMLSRSPRRPEMFPRRRRTSPTDLTRIGGGSDQL